MKTTTTTFFSLLALLPAMVAGHGFVQDMTIDGNFIKGNPVGQPATGPSGIRQVTSPNPIKGAQNRNVNCGTGATAADLILDAMPGSNLTFNWRGADGSTWPHDIGPILTYMASCGSTTCDKFDPINAQWFKIKQDGLKADGNWTQIELFNGGVSSATIPETLAPGNYMVRHEIIALHLATAMGGAEFYEGCVQTRIGGNQTGAPSPSDLVSLPGAYSDSDPGIFDPNVFDAGAPYTFPGPPVTKLAGTAPTNGTNPAPPASGGSCQLKTQGTSKSRRSAGADAEAFPLRPRRLSRIMRNLRLH
jgi:hypothetical protein